jgi:hypothetical protein
MKKIYISEEPSMKNKGKTYTTYYTS